MNKTKLNELKKIIQKTEKTILHEIEELEEKTTPIAPDISLGRLTRLEAMQEKSINEAILATARIRLKKIKYALNKLATSEYGMCSICDEEIPYKRLCVVPESSICVECANIKD